MARVNHKKVRQLISQKRKTITDRQFFSSRLLAGHFEDMAVAQTRRYTHSRRVKVRLVWEPKNQKVAYTDNGLIWINAGHQLVTGKRKRIERYDIVCGLFAHELGHTLGLPDLYDTDEESNGKAVDMSIWCVMASGNYLNNEKTPCLHSAWCRHQLGWLNVEQLPDYETKKTLPASNDSSIAYRFNTVNENEYFLMENRQRQGWNFYIPGNGLLIYHIDENNGSYWVNKRADRRGIAVEQAGCSQVNGCEKNVRDRMTDPFPRSAKNSFTDFSMPNAKTYNGKLTNKPVTEITQNEDRTISFTFMQGVPNAIQTSVEENPLKSWISDNVLHIEGLRTGEEIFIYDISGIRIYQGIATDNIAQLPCNTILKKRGVYILRTEERAIKVVW